MSPLLLIIILIILFGGGLGWHSGWGYYGVGPYGGLGLILVIIVVIWALGRGGI
jgi:hypothetical protein